MSVPVVHGAKQTLRKFVQSLKAAPHKRQGLPLLPERCNQVQPTGILGQEQHLHLCHAANQTSPDDLVESLDPHRPHHFTLIPGTHAGGGCVQRRIIQHSDIFARCTRRTAALRDVARRRTSASSSGINVRNCIRFGATSFKHFGELYHKSLSERPPSKSVMHRGCSLSESRISTAMYTAGILPTFRLHNRSPSCIIAMACGPSCSHGWLPAWADDGIAAAYYASVVHCKKVVSPPRRRGNSPVSSCSGVTFSLVA